MNASVTQTSGEVIPCLQQLGSYRPFPTLQFEHCPEHRPPYLPVSDCSTVRVLWHDLSIPLVYSRHTILSSGIVAHGTIEKTAAPAQAITDSKPRLSLGSLQPARDFADMAWRGEVQLSGSRVPGRLSLLTFNTRRWGLGWGLPCMAAHNAHAMRLSACLGRARQAVESSDKLRLTRLSSVCRAQMRGSERLVHAQHLFTQ